MSHLVPRNHAPVSFATVFLIASILHEQTNKSDDEEQDEYFRRFYLPVASYKRPGSRRIGIDPVVRHELVSVSIELIPSYEKPINPYEYNSVRIVFRDLYDAAFRTKAENVSWSGPDPFHHLSLTLRPPFNTCLSPENVKRCINGGLVRALSPLPEGFGINFPSFEDDAKMRYRQALADGLLSGVVLEESGRTSPIPGHFWRSSAAEAAFLEDGPITFEADGRKVAGTPLVDLAALRDDWRSAFNGAPAAMQMTARSFSPYLDFLLDVARDLNMIDGCDANGNRIPAQTLRQKVDDMWKKKNNGDSPNTHKLNMMVTMLRHPSHEKGGNLSKEAQAAAQAAAKKQA